MIHLCSTCGCKDAESFNANESEPIEYSQYRRRINYLEMIYNAFYDYDSSIYQLRDTWTQFINSEGYIEIDNLIRRDILQGSSQLGGQPLFFGNGAYLKMKTNVKNALQRASGTKLSSSMRLHHGGLILAQYEYNGKTFFVQQWMRGSGNSRSTRLMVASEDSIPEDRRGLAENRGFFDADILLAISETTIKERPVEIESNPGWDAESFEASKPSDLAFWLMPGIANDIFDTKEEAMERAKELGVNEIHQHKIINNSGNEDIIFMPYKSHQEYERKEGAKRNLGDNLPFNVEDFGAEVRGHTLYPYNYCVVCGGIFNKLIICDVCGYQVCDTDAKDNMVEFDGSKKGLGKKAHYCKECNYKNPVSFDAESYDDESPMMKNITVIGAFALAIIIGKKLKR